MKRTDFTFRKAWMIYTVYFFLLFTPTANAQQTASLVNLELKNEKLSAALKQIEKMGGKNILFAYEETENYHVTASIRKQTQGEVIRTVLKGIPQRMILFTSNDNSVYTPRYRSLHTAVMSCFIKKTQKEKFSDRCSRSYIPVWCATPPNYWATEKKPVILWVV